MADEIGLAKGTKVVTGTGDVHSAVIGSGALADYAGHLYIGTSSWLTCHVPWKRTDVLNSQASIPSALPGRYFIANEHETAGECLDFLVDNVLFADDLLGTERPAGVFQKLDALAATSPAGSNDVLFAPWLNGERTPVDDHTIRGGWHHLSLSSTRADMVRSVLEGVAFNSRWLLDVVEKFIKRPLPSLNFIGGGARSDLWCQIHADVLDRPINQMVDPQQANVRGAAFVASIALGPRHGGGAGREGEGGADLPARSGEPGGVRRALRPLQGAVQGQQGPARQDGAALTRSHEPSRTRPGWRATLVG